MEIKREAKKEKSKTRILIEKSFTIVAIAGISYLTGKHRSKKQIENLKGRNDPLRSEKRQLQNDYTKLSIAYGEIKERYVNNK